MNQKVQEIVRNAESARSAVLMEDWGLAERMLTEVQDRVGRLLREVGDKTREKLMTPKPD